MRVFLTGASGHIGSALIPELISAGHSVVGLARSDDAAALVAERGAEVVRGGLDDLDVLRAAASDSDGVIHLAFRHDLMQVGDMAGAADSDLAALTAIGDAVRGTGKPLVGTSGTLLLAASGITGRPGTEEDALPSGYRIDSENFVIGLADDDVRSSVVRLPPTVHSDLDRHGFIPGLIGFARDRGSSGYLGDGHNRWPAVHTRDAARVYRRALESAPAGTRLHAVAEEGVPFREIAAAIGRGLDVPVVSVPKDPVPNDPVPEDSVPKDQAADVFGYLAGFVGIDNPTSSTLTRELLDWGPEFPGLLSDLADGHYFT